MTTQDYANNTPTLDIREYLNGPLEAHGMLQDWRGKVTRRFVVTMRGSWQGNVGTLEEHFTFDDGEKDSRIWTLKMSDDHHFTATAHDCIGVAQGSQHGNAVNMQYTLRVKYGEKKDKTIDLSMDDWLILQNETTLLNVTSMRKFGFEVGRLTIAFTKLKD